jgi:ribosomal protein S27AE
VVSREKINLDKVLRSLNVTCPRCGASLAPIERQRLDDDRVGCLKCGKDFQRWNMM